MIAIGLRLTPLSSPDIPLELRRNVSRRRVNLDGDHFVSEARQRIRRRDRVAVDERIETLAGAGRHGTRQTAERRCDILDPKSLHALEDVAELARVLVEDVVVGEI